MPKPLSPLDVKRARLVELLIQRNRAALESAQRFQDLDHNLAGLLERCDVEVLRRDVARLSEEHIDRLLEYHAPTTARHVW